MYPKSILNTIPLSIVSNVPVAIVCLGDEQKFIHISEDYEKTLELISESFDIPDNVLVSLRTSSLNVCQGKEIEVHKSAYPLLWPFLDKVQVNIAEPAQVNRRQEKRDKEKSRAISPELPPTPFKDNFEMEDFPEASSTVIHAPLDEEYSRTSITEEIAQGIGASSSKVVSDTTGGRVDDDKVEGYQVPQEKIVPLKSTDIRPITENKDNGEGGTNLQKKFRPAVVLLPISNKEISSPTTVKKEKIVDPGNEATPPKPSEAVKPAIPVPAASQSDEDPRFEITIIGPKNETAQFKTRGKHPVRKVLAAACKTFGIKYERARLILCVSIEEEGEIQTDEFDCPAEETMSRCGVDSNAKLFVRVNPDHNDGEYQEE